MMRTVAVHAIPARYAGQVLLRTTCRALAAAAIVLVISRVCLAAGLGSQASPSSVPQDLTVIGDNLYFSANDGIHGREPWVLSAAGAPRLLADIVPGEGDSAPLRYLEFDHAVYFEAKGIDGGRHLFRFDPVANQVEQVQFPSELAATADYFPVGELDGRLIVFVLFTHHRHYFAIEPGSLDAILLFHLPSADMSAFSYITDSRIIFGCSGTIYTSDGSVNDPVAIAEGISQSYFSAAFFHQDIVYCAFESPAFGHELLRTDGTREGSFMVCDINPGPADAYPRDFVALRSMMLFASDDGTHGNELWCMSAGSGDVQLVKDICPGSSSGAPHYPCVVGDRLFFVGDDCEYGEEIWISDGTPEGTRIVSDLNAGAQGSGPWSPAAFDAKLYFCANTQEFGEEVYVTDGTAEGTRILRDIVPGEGWSGPDNLTVFNDLLYFTCNDGRHGEELWRTDGTTDGTVVAADIALPQYNPSSSPRHLTAFADSVLFVADDGQTGLELWRSDGTEAGTVPVTDIARGRADAAPGPPCVIGNRVCFAAENGESGREIWVSDGSANGATLLRDIVPGPASSAPEQLARVGDSVFFTAGNTAHGRDLWVTQGTPESTKLLHAASEGTGDVLIGTVFDLFGDMYFYTGTPDAERTLWGTDGTVSGTRRLAVLSSPTMPWDLGDASLLGLSVDDSVDAAGSERIALVSAVHPFSKLNEESPCLDLDGWTYFVANQPCFGAELWKSDGTAAGTTLAADIFPGRAGSCPDEFRVFDGLLYFVAEHIRDGRVLWQTDGTQEGTRVVTPVGPGYHYPAPMPRELAVFERGLVLFTFTAYHELPDDCGVGLLTRNPAGLAYSHLKTVRRGAEGWPRQLTVAGNQAFFTADDGKHGEELWHADLDRSAVSIVTDLLTPGDLSPIRP